jgi:hypothetical protein
MVTAAVWKPQAARNQAAELRAQCDVPVNMYRLRIVLAREGNDLLLGDLVFAGLIDLPDGEVFKITCQSHPL